MKQIKYGFFTIATLAMALFVGCSSAEKKPTVDEQAPVQQQAAQAAPADLGASSAGRGL